MHSSHARHCPRFAWWPAPTKLNQTASKRGHRHQSNRPRHRKKSKRAHGHIKGASTIEIHHASSPAVGGVDLTAVVFHLRQRPQPNAQLTNTGMLSICLLPSCLPLTIVSYYLSCLSAAQLVRTRRQPETGPADDSICPVPVVNQ
jgi:hypothetical protein